MIVEFAPVSIENSANVLNNRHGVDSGRTLAMLPLSVKRTTCKYYKHPASAHGDSRDISERVLVYSLYVIGFELLDREYRESNATYLTFPMVLSRTRDMFLEALLSTPVRLRRNNLPVLRHLLM